MKIALVCDWYRPRVGGIELHLEGLARQLAAAGHDVTVITPTPGSGDDHGSVRVHRLRGWLLPWVGLAWTPLAFRRLGAVLRAGQFDVVHAHSSLISPTAYAALWQAQACGLPAVLTVHSIWGGFSGMFAALNGALGWARWPVVFSAVSEHVARDMRPLLRFRSVHILANAIVPQHWMITPNLPANGINIACVMRLAPRKRGTALLRALQVVRAQLPADVRLDCQIAGDGPERRKLEGLAVKLGLADWVRFHGAVDSGRVRALLAESHFFVLPTVLEAFGLAALEARAAGLPVVAMRAGGVGEWLTDEVEGLLADDDGDLVRCILRLASDRALLADMTAHNRRTPVTFTWDRAVAAHLALYAHARQITTA
jgi:glycosyltransferase involved in cell wall biosynthesis